MTSDFNPDGTDFDKHIGARMRHHRKLRGMTQQDLARLLGISFQQVQKYERGSNKISFERLLHLSRIFGVTLEHWQPALLPAPPQPSRTDHRQALNLLHAFHRLQEPEHRELLCSLARTLAGPDMQADMPPP